MARLPVDELLIFSRKAVLTAIGKALETRPVGGFSEKQAAAGLERPPVLVLDGPERPSVLVLDATAGNGVDTEFLAQAVEEGGLVLAFDVQDEALQNTRERLEKFRVGGRVRLLKDSHERLGAYLGPYLAAGTRVTAAMYNLGFLPGGASKLSTLAESTVTSLEQLRPCMASGSVISIHCYAGHEQGQAETAAVRAWAESLPWTDWRVLRYEFCNKPSNREALFLVTCL